MNTESSVDPFWVLYLVNVLQPVDRQTLDAQGQTLARTMPGRTEPIDVNMCLGELASSGLVMLRSDNCYTATSLGLERLSQFRLGRIRDKNRLFVLKKLLKRD